MVTHRLDQLQQMTHILVLDKGLIVQKGSFNELSLQEGLFRLMQQDASNIGGI